MTQAAITRLDDTAGDDLPPPLPDVLQFMQVLWAVAHGLERASKRMTADIGVTGPQRLVLRVAGLYPGLSAGELSSILHVHPSTLTGVLQRLVKQRLLERLDDPRDRRRAMLRLTARGRRVNAVGRGTVEAGVAAALATVGPRERATTQRVLEQITAHLHGDAAPAAAPGPRQVRARKGVTKRG